jgi:hypothetical protein
MISLWQWATCRPTDYPWYVTNNRWRSVDAHFHDGAGRVLHSVLPRKEAKNPLMTDCNLSEVWFPRTHDQKSLTLHWRSFSWWGWEGFAISFAHKGRQNLVYNWVQHIRSGFSQYEWPEIVDSPLMLIFMMGQGGYCTLNCLGRKPKIPLWLTTTNQRCEFTGRMTKNHWCSVDAHFHDGAGRVLLSVLPIGVGKKSIATDYNLWEAWFHRMHHQKSLTFRWHSFWWWGREGIAICFAYKGGQKNLCDWLQPIGGLISQDAWPKIVDTPLMLILPWLYLQYGIF